MNLFIFLHTFEGMFKYKGSPHETKLIRFCFLLSLLPVLLKQQMFSIPFTTCVVNKRKTR